jgi:hypothetical protein
VGQDEKGGRQATGLEGQEFGSCISRAGLFWE